MDLATSNFVHPELFRARKNHVSIIAAETNSPLATRVTSPVESPCLQKKVTLHAWDDNRPKFHDITM